MSDEENSIPQVMVSTEEVQQSGRDVGILYGIIIGLFILSVSIKFGVISMLHSFGAMLQALLSSLF